MDVVKTHDLIVVGAGTAGSVLAERLTHSGTLRVLLVEAGGKPSSPFVKIPAGFPQLFRSKLDWAFESEPNASCGGRRVFVPRGKMLGGSSNINVQMHQWCHPADFDGWEAAGATGWSWTDVAPVFRLQERWEGGEANGPRGHDGPMVISPNRRPHPVSTAFVEAARSAGLDGPASYNGGAYEGAWLAELAHRSGRRFSAYDAYLKPALRRPNLTVSTGAHVTRVEIENGRAVGVRLRRGDGEEIHRAERGVVLAAGAFGSPQLLLLSGIGPAEALGRLGIEVERDLPEVGANLQEHPMVVSTFRTSRTDTFKNAGSLLELVRYLVFRRGLLASNVVETLAFARAVDRHAPDLEIMCVPLEWRNQGLEPPQVHAVSLGAAAVASRSRGRVTLRSADPLAAPVIDLNLLSDPDGADAAVLVAGIRWIRRIAATSPLSRELLDEIAPGASADGDTELLTWIRANVQTVYHPTSTCRMGTDPGAVVDPDLRVRGVDGLWVADASVMPTVPRGHPNAVVAMIAHRAAAWIERGASATSAAEAASRAVHAPQGTSSRAVAETSR